MTMMMFLTLFLCALNELQWRLIDMPSLKNVFFYAHANFFLFELLAFLTSSCSFLDSNPPRRYFESLTASMCEFVLNKESKSIYAAAVSTISNIWLTEWLTDWLNIFCGCLNIPQMNRRLQFSVFLHGNKKKENLWNVCGRWKSI